MAAATEFERFLVDFPAYRSTSALDDLRAADYAHLDAHNHTYLDYTGACLYGVSQLREHALWLSSGVFGNPHSASPASAKSSRYRNVTLVSACVAVRA